jgi:preprotein translocase subunit SecG
MVTVLLIIHIFVTISLIGVVLIQRSEGGGLGIGSSQGMGAFMSGRGTANLLTRTTAILAAIFMALSLTLALLNRGTNTPGRSILEIPAAPAPATAPLTPTPAVPAPAVPAPTAPAPAASAPAAPSAATPSTPPAGGTPPTAPATGGAPAPAPAPAKPAGPSVPTN